MHTYIRTYVYTCIHTYIHINMHTQVKREYTTVNYTFEVESDEAEPAHNVTIPLVEEIETEELAK